MTSLMLMIGICMTSVLYAQDTLKVDLAKSVEIALDQNKTIKVAEKEIERVDYANLEKKSALLPTIGASASYQRAVKKQKMFFSFPGMPANPDGIEVGQDNTFAGVLSASMPIIAPTLWASLKLNETEAQMALESARSSKLSLVNNVTKAYYAVLLSQDSYHVFEKAYKSSGENAKVIYDKFKQGTVSEFEWIRADVQLRNAQTNLVSASSAVSMSKLQLKLLLGVPMDIEVVLDGKLSDYENKIFDQAIKAGANNVDENTDLKQFDIRMDQMKKSLEINKTTWLPTLAASFNFQYMTMPNDDVAFKDYYWFPTSTAGLSLSVPIFQGGSKHFKSKQLKIQMEELKDQRVNLRRSLELQAISYTDNMIKAIEKIESTRKGLSQAEKSLSISQKMYEVGMATYLDINSAELAYIQAGLSYNQAIFDFVSAKSDLEKLLGTSLE